MSDDEDEYGPHNIFREDRLHVLSEECATCIFRPATRPVPGSRVAQLVRDTKDEEGATVVCHSTLYESEGAPRENAVCRGWFDRFAKDDPIIRLAQAMDIIEEQAPTVK